MQISGSGNPMNSGLAGIQQGQEKLTQAAQEVASANTQRSVQPSQGTKEVDLEKALLDQKQGQRQVEVSAKVVQAGSQMLGSLVDLKV
ncbi:MAG: flagellar basal body rod protein FlgG [Psychrobacter glaciei]|jgi:flagellar basal body rod protein FlgG